MRCAGLLAPLLATACVATNDDATARELRPIAVAPDQVEVPITVDAAVDAPAGGSTPTPTLPTPPAPPTGVEQSAGYYEVLQLRAIEDALVSYYAQNGRFPAGHATDTPAARCCAGSDPFCPDDPADWTGVWALFPFARWTPARYQHTYHSVVGSLATVSAIGDTDCNGVYATFTLTCVDGGGFARCQLHVPASVD